MTSTVSALRERAAAARVASRALARLSSSAKNAALELIATLLETEQDAVLAANALDLQAGREAGLDDYFIERLTLTPERLRGIASDTRGVMRLEDPVGEVFDSRTLPNGMLIGRRRVPLGVIACIYESRPNVTVDIAVLAMKSGNAAILRGGKEARNSNAALGLLIQRALEGTDVPPGAVQVVSDPDRAHVDELLEMNDLVDLIVPRGGAQLIDYVRRKATMPVVAHGDAVVQIYVDSDLDLEMALNVVDNAKTRRYSICNAVDTLLIHEAIAPQFLGRLAALWGSKVTFLVDARAGELLAGSGAPVAAIAGKLAGMEREALLGALHRHGIPAASAVTRDETTTDPWLHANGFWEEYELAGFGTVAGVRSYAEFSRTPGGFRYPAPRLGEHTDEVLAGLGRTEVAN
ncbi:MAG: glutamate-5-semialdehyde dehydrogenase [Dehalococcoidia bacterium]|nr:MAG: glutamate-5-semialdehyde dehydrogenase [Dehalococcoidia bacterium]